MRIIFLISAVVLLVTCSSFLVYEYDAFRKTTHEKLSTIGKIIAANSTAALAFDDHDGAKEILAALKTEPHIVGVALYNKNGKLFSTYISSSKTLSFPDRPGAEGYHFIPSYLEGFEPVVQDGKLLGVLYLKSDLGAMYERFLIFAIVAVSVVLLSFLLAYILSSILQKRISKPILGLAATANIISNEKNYSVRAVKTSNDEVGLLTSAFNDMLEQIHQQNELMNEFNQNLERKVQERTIQLESVNRELESFSYSISHDLRAPLRAIIGYTAILEEDYTSKLDDEARRVTTVIKNNTMKMGHLIDDLLAFSKMGKRDIQKATVDTLVMVKEIISGLSVQYDTSKVKWILHSLPPVQADSNTFRQVWINLLANAIKYSGNKETPHIEVGSSKKDGKTTFFVKDNGVGFDEKYKDKLFKVFQRLHSADEFEGTGVGLALVERIISKHGGSVWAEAEMEKGATFYFSLPDHI